jgi:Gas vesicle synthesis protein GvpO
MAERRSARTIRHDDDYDDELPGDELADNADEEFSGRDAALTAAQAAQSALRQIAELTGKQVEGITGVGPAEAGWVVRIEVVEDRRIPSSSDILAAYEAGLDMDGELLSYRRVGRYPRGRGDRGI